MPLGKKLPRFLSAIRQKISKSLFIKGILKNLFARFDLALPLDNFPACAQNSTS
jgi:hypothetical protein